jgi:hypothetical protein
MEEWKDYLTAEQLAKSLMPHLFADDNNKLTYDPTDKTRKIATSDERLEMFLMWPPDLFALTSSILSLTGAYNAVVSPPSGEFIDEISELLRKLGGANAERTFKDQLEDKIGTKNNSQVRDRWRTLFSWPPKIQLQSVDVERAVGHCLLQSAKSIVDIDAPEDWARMVRRIAIEWRLRIERCCRPVTNGDNLPQLLVDSSHNWDHLKSMDGLVIPKDLRKIWDIARVSMTRNRSSTESVFDILCEDNWEYFFDVSDFDRLTGSERRDELARLIEAFVEWANKRIQLNFALQAILTLHAISDEASTGFGLRSIELNDQDLSTKKIRKKTQELISMSAQASESSSDSAWILHKPILDENSLLKSIAERMKEFGTLATINPQHCRVLPKRHTPAVGITLRSISCNLGFHRSSVDVKWLNPHAKASNPLETRLFEGNSKSEATRLSILLLPWPLEISAQDFKEVQVKSITEGNEGLFTFSPASTTFSQSKVASAIRSALLETKSVDMVILPEGALAEAEIPVLEEALTCKYTSRGVLAPPVSSYIAGVRRDPQKPGDFGDNMVFFKTAVYPRDQQASVFFEPTGKDGGIQYKHHKWKLDSSQVVAYSLGHSLAPGTNWWEAIRIRRRRVTFMNIGEQITVCPLICEDLARQDPISDLIRTAGPTLVVTILMDGPQLRGRWSSNYASVLADDPGCAVITLSSYGMVKRWRPEYAKEGSRVVAHWRDGKSTSREIELDDGAIGVLLSVTLSEQFESTADGRNEVFKTTSLQLGAIKQVFPFEDTNCNQ